MNTRFKRGGSGEFYPSAWDYLGAAHPRVLLAESDDELRHFFATGLRRSGHAVLAVADGREALATISSISRGDLPRPDAAILEVCMPFHSGMEILAAIRAAEWPTPVILLSTRLHPQRDARKSDLQVFASLRKPISSARLVRTISEAIAACVQLRSR